MKPVCTVLALILAALMAPPALSAPYAYDTIAFDTNLVVAKVGQAQATLGDLHRMVVFSKMYRNNPLEDNRRRAALLDRWISDQLVAAEARNLSLKNQHGILGRIRRTAIVAAANLYIHEEVSRMYQLDSATIDTFYNNHITRYSSPRDQRRVRVITVWKEGKAPTEGMGDFIDSTFIGWYPEDKIDSLYKALAAGEDFARLAAQHSEDPITRGAGGELGWISEKSVGGGIFAEVAMRQPLFMISKPFETDNAWQIVQAYAERPAGPVAMDAEIRLDVITHLTEQQRAKILRETGDSLMAVSKIAWNDAVLGLPHEQLKPNMVMAVVGGRDTLYADEYLLDQYKWMNRSTGEFPSPEDRQVILRGEYVRYLCWLGFLRERGYFNRLEIQQGLAEQTQKEREAIVLARMSAGRAEEPDSAAIRRHYEENKQQYGLAPNSLELSWNAIRTKLMNDAEERMRRRWLESAAARHGVVRYDDRLATLPLLEHKPKK